MTTALEAHSHATAREDDAITADRDETKYLVPHPMVAGLFADLQKHLPLHRFTGAGANRLPDAHHYVTTIYFDTPSSIHYRTATTDTEHNIKVRAKEYYDLHPSLAEVARDPSDLVRYQPWLWFELKRRAGARTFKHRFRLPKRDVPSFFAEGRVTAEVLALSDADGATGLQDIISYIQQLQEPLAAVSVVNYRRLSWQAPSGDLRVTLDLGLAFYAPAADLFSRERALVRDTLGAPCGRESHLVLEIKRNASIPAWLEQSLTQAGVRPQVYSKFVAARRAQGIHD